MNIPNQIRSPVLNPITTSRLVYEAVCLFTSWQVGYAEKVMRASGSLRTEVKASTALRKGGNIPWFVYQALSRRSFWPGYKT